MPNKQGESQLRAGMILLATTLGVRAVQQGIFFNKAIIFGQLRMVEQGQCYLYKLLMDFEKHQSQFCKAEDPMDPSKLFYSVIRVLKDPSKKLPKTTNTEKEVHVQN